MAEETPPKLFVSYSWSSPEHEAWVLRLAEELVSSGVDVILDKWDLREGHDAIQFMEQMVADETITKVIMVCDKPYVEKTNEKKGGAGTEAQIISPKIYQQSDQNKFVAVVVETDENGRPHLPIYYQSRIYIDLSAEEIYAENFEKLVRWAFDKPLHVRPEIGKRPAFLSDPNQISSGTSAQFRRVAEATRNQKPHVHGAMSEYFDTVATNLEKYRISDDDEGEFDEKVVESIDQLLPLRNEVIEVFSLVAQYLPDDQSQTTVHRFIEQLIPYTDRLKDIRQYREWDFDNLRFFVQEIFLYSVAILLKHERFDFSANLLAQDFYAPTIETGEGGKMVSYVYIRHYLKSLAHRNKRLELRRLSLHADMLEQRSRGAGLLFDHVMQADLLLFLRSCKSVLEKEHRHSWFPDTLLYANERYWGSFEVFARAQSRQYFEKLKSVLGVDSVEELGVILEHLREGRLHLPQWEFSRPDVPSLTNFEKLATKP